MRASMAHAGGGAALRGAVATLLLLANVHFAWGQCETDKLLASDGTSGDFLGWDVDISADVAIVGGYSSNAAYVYRFDGSAWTEESVLTAVDTIPQDLFGAAVATDGDVAAVAAPSDADQGFASGSVYIFRFDPVTSAWVREIKLLASDGGLTQVFGASVALSGGTLAVGSPGDNENGNNAGSVYIFRFNGADWVEEAKLLASDGMPSDLLGRSVDIDDDAVTAGAIGHDQNGDASGAAYVFRFDGTEWIEETKLLDPRGAPSDNFGDSVAISGDAVVVGAADDGPGSAFAFRFDGAHWMLESHLLASDGESGDAFGNAVGIDGDAIVVGAAADDNRNGVAAGSAYLFRFDGSAWQQQALLLASSGSAFDNFGQSIAVSGDLALVGSIEDDDNGSDAGAAYVFAGITNVDCNGNGVPDGCDLHAGESQDTNGNGVPDECDCLWDLDGDGAVGVPDFLDLLAQWGTDPGGPPDFDGDGTVGTTDFLALLANWGSCS